MKVPLAAAAALLLGACTSYVDPYEKAVYDWQPTYCYQSIGGVQCFATPYHRDEKRLVNYFGPHPSRYDRPQPPPPPHLVAPPPVDFYVRDPEPIPRPEPPMAMSRSPTAEPRAEAATPAVALPPAGAEASPTPEPGSETAKGIPAGSI